MKEYTLPYLNLAIFFNPLLRSGNDIHFELVLPLLDNLEVCNLTITTEGPVIQNFVTFNSYNRIYKKIAQAGRKYISDELPDYNQLQDALVYSAIVKPSGLDLLFEYIHEASKQSVIRGGDVYYIAFDTNILMDRIYTNYLRDYSDAPNIDFILSETVRSELTNRKNKINKKTINDLAEAFGKSARCFSNQNVLADRRRYIGFLEFNKIRHETDCDQLKPSRSIDDKDEEIIETYAKFAVQGYNRKVLLISRDNEFIRMSPSLPDVIPIVIENRVRDRSIKQMRCGYNKLFSFIYHLSVLYGEIVLQLKGHNIYKCYGVWPQKNVRQWENNHIKVSANSELPYITSLDHHTNILKKMKYKRESRRFPKTD